MNKNERATPIRTLLTVRAISPKSEKACPRAQRKALENRCFLSGFALVMNIDNQLSKMTTQFPAGAS